MRQYRECITCKNKYDLKEFDGKVNRVCRACCLIGKRLTRKFDEMVADGTNGLSELNSYLDNLYVME
jgi:hypothetical protein